jgi:AcrR family transcriptional regulator
VQTTKTGSASPSAGMRDRILNATERLLGRYGYRKMTMEDVADEAGIAKRTIYMHFASKEEVALSSIDRVVARLAERLHAIAESDAPADERIEEMLLCRVLFRFDAVRDYRESVDEIFETLRPAYMARRQAYFNLEAEIIAEVLAEGRRSKVLTVNDPTETAHTLLLATNGLLPSALSVPELGRRKDVEKKTRQVARLLLNGLRRDRRP